MGQAGKQKRRAEGQVKAKLSPRDKMLKDVRNMAKRVARLGKKLAKLPPELKFDTGGESTMTVSDGIAAMVEMFNALASDIDTALPVDWKPANGKRGRPGLVVGVGDNVQIREKSAAKYADLFPAGTCLVVTDVRAALVGVKAPSGVVMYIPKGHLVRAPDPATGSLASAVSEED